MMTNLRYTTLAVLLVLLVAILPSCADDPLSGDFGPVGPGECSVSATVGFQPFGTALESRSSGNAIKSIEQLYVLFYDEDYRFLFKKHVTAFDLKADNNDRPSDDAGVSAETNTPRATFSLPDIPYGKYHIYAVANVDVDAEWSESDYETVAALQSRPVHWSSASASDNNQMLGYFSSDNSGQGFESPVITIDKPQLSLTSWIRRVASKVTVAFDTRRLRDNIYIYIKSVSIKDIPEEAYLGRTNTPGGEGRDGISDKLLDGETIYYADADASQADYKGNYKKWRCITNGDSIYGYYSELHGKQHGDAEKRLAAEHGENVNALYFYENMQGKGTSGTATDKRQDVSGNNKQVSYPNGNDPDDEGFKDSKRYGTYVEVDGYYVCNYGRPGRGPIKYRFMLGKDTHIDYNAERNHHYKLTLTFNGYANDIDWHIDYKEEENPGLYTPETYYVSYLYNQTAMLQGRATPKPGYRLTGLKAVIIDNEWRPHEAAAGLYNENAWNMQIDSYNAYAGISPIRDDPEAKPNCEFGFLALVKLTGTVYEFGGSSRDYKPMVQKMCKFYHGQDDTYKTSKQGYREYNSIPASVTGPQGQTVTSPDGDYNIIYTQKDDKKDYVFNLPLFTRAKTLDPWGVYTGANPYYSHQRYARVKIYAYYESEIDSKSKYTDVSYTKVYQSYRIDNPRGVWRRHNNASPFNVRLLYQKSGISSAYSSVVSQGPWAAVIEHDPHGLVKLTGNGQTAVGEGQQITGLTGTEVTFVYTPRHTVDADRAEGAVITVYYHNRSCVHKVLVRQGYAPVALVAGGAKWSTFNVYDKSSLTKSPLALGSMFRRNDNFDYSILEKNDARPGFGVGENPGANAVYHMGGGRADTKWTDIKYIGSGTRVPFGGSFTFDNKSYKMPEESDVQSLIDNANINYAYGILYADGATATATDESAFKYTDYENTGAESVNGVRGVILYDTDQRDSNRGNQIFFPYGATGHGRRKNHVVMLNKGTSGYGYGYRRYGSIDAIMDGLGDRPFDNYRPLAYDLPSQFGAAYWITLGENKKCTIDINAGTYTFYFLNPDNVYTGDDKAPDALPVKPVLVN